MFKILEARELTTNIFQMIVEAPRVAGSCLPGQFLIIRVNGDGESIPLTICDYDREKGTVEIVVQAIGAETYKLSKLKAGDELADVVGPLGKPSDLVEEDIEELKETIKIMEDDGEDISEEKNELAELEERLKEVSL